MAFKLTKAEDARKAEIEANLEQLVGEVEDGRNELQEAIQKLVDDFNEKYIDPFNAALGEAGGFIEDIYNERQNEYDERSERWQEGDNGQNAYEWLQNWENAVGELEEMSPLECPVLELEITDAANIVAGLEGEAY